jgi:hypothetical protein
MSKMHARIAGKPGKPREPGELVTDYVRIGIHNTVSYGPAILLLFRIIQLSPLGRHVLCFKERHENQALVNFSFKTMVKN